MIPAPRRIAAGRTASARASLAVGTILAATALIAPPAAAAPFTFSFDWAGDPATGFFGWQRTDQLPNPGAGPPFLPPYYASLRSTAGAGIRLRPSPAADGTRDRVYSNYDPTTQSGGPKINEIYTAPGTTTIARARIRDVSFLNDSEGQIMRAAIIDQNGAFVAESAYGMDDGSPPPGPFLPGVSYTNIVLPQLFWPGYATGIPSHLELSLRTICVPAGNCPLVRFQGDGTPLSSGRFGTVELDLIDPEAPAVALSGSLTTSSAWVNTSRSGRLALNAQDPGSGLRKLRLERRGSTAATVLLNETITCDLAHASPPPGTLAGGACPAQVNRSVTQNVSTNGVTTFIVTATDLSGEATTAQTQVRVDRQRPTAAVAGAVRSIQGRWTNRADEIGATVSGQDALSGISRLALTASGASSGTPSNTVVCATGTGPTSRCRPVDSARVALRLADLQDGRNLIRPVATDLAGNRSATAPALTLLLDRRAPGAAQRLHLSRSSSGARATFSRPSAGGGSPIVGAEVRSAISGGPFSAWRATRASTVSVGGAGRAISFEVRIVDGAGNRSRVARADLRAAASSATGRTTCRAGARCPRKPGRVKTIAGRFGDKIKAAEADSGVKCPVPVQVTKDRRIAQDAEHFQAQNVNKGVRITLGQRFGGALPVCGPYGTIVRMAGTVTIERVADRTPPVAGPFGISLFVLGGEILADGVHEARVDCEPAMDGVQRYDVRSLSGFTGSVIDPLGRPRPISPKKSPLRLRITWTCPDKAVRQSNELLAWHALEGYNPATRRYTTRLDTDDYARSTLRRRLVRELGRNPGLSLEAHHIIPLRDLGTIGLPVVTSSFRCKLYPNELANGVFLRARDWRKGTDLFNALGREDRSRTWHPFTQRSGYLDEYFGLLRRYLVRGHAIADDRGTCRDRGTFDRVMATIKQKLADGTFFSDRPER